MENRQSFHTQKGYELIAQGRLTSSMEDYIEMIYRLTPGATVVRISELAQSLNVKPSSASKMARSLEQLGYVEFERYGYVKLTQSGAELGRYLIYRHDVLNAFLCYVNATDSELEQVERIEHFFDEKTVGNIERLTRTLKAADGD